jgi:hypothetical protein
MPDRRVPPLTTGHLLRSRAVTRWALLASTAAAIAVAVATIAGLLAVLARAIASAGDQPPPGMSDDALAEQIAIGTSALLSAAPAPLLLVVILASTATAQLGRLIASAREHETTTIRARGLSKAQAVRIDATEALVVAAVGAVVGLGIAAGVLGLANADPGAVLSVWWVAPATALVLGAVLVLATRAPSRSGRRGARATTATVVVLLIAAAVFVVWQLQFARPQGFDPVVAATPAVVLLAAALVALAVFGAIAAAWARVAASRRGLSPSYPARQVARRLPIFAVAVLLVALTVAQSVFASAYSATSTELVTDSAAQRAGADLRVDLAPSTVTAAHVASVAEIEGVDAAAPALVNPLEFGDTDAELVAVPADAIERVVAGSPAELDTLASAVAAPEPFEPPSLGDGATGVRVAVSVDAPQGIGTVPQLVAVVVDARGTAEAIRLIRPFEPVYSDTTVVEFEAEGVLPSGQAPWRLVAVTATLPPSIGLPTIVVRLDSVEGVGGDALDIEGEVTLTRDIPGAHVWIAAVAAEPPVVPVAVSADLADRLGLATGDELDFRYAGTGRFGALRVEAVAEEIPGAATPFAVFADLVGVQLSMLQRGTSFVPAVSVWASGDPAAAPAMSETLGGRPVATASPGVAASLVGALAPAWWVAAVGSVVLSLVAAFAIVQTLGIARRREVGVLRALGVGRGRQARMRGAELGGVLGLAVVLGGAAGAVAAWFTVPRLVAAVTPGVVAADATTSFAIAPLVIVVSALVVGLALVAVLASAAVRRAARTATLTDDDR